MPGERCYTGEMRIGLVADTHGYLGDDVCAALAGCERILHAGDVGDNVLERLAAIAPLTAVRGNNDTDGETALLPEVAFVEAAGVRIAVVHRLVDAPPPPWDVLVFGHCHKQHAYEHDGRLLANPGAAGNRGFHRTRSIALLDLGGSKPEVTFIDFGPRTAKHLAVNAAPAKSGARDLRSVVSSTAVRLLTRMVRTAYSGPAASKPQAHAESGRAFGRRPRASELAR
jgi:uncharacterized protein